MVCNRYSESGQVNCMSASRGASKAESRVRFVGDGWLRAARVASSGDNEEARLLMSIAEREVAFGGLLAGPTAQGFCEGVRGFGWWSFAWRASESWRENCRLHWGQENGLEPVSGLYITSVARSCVARLCAYEFSHVSGGGCSQLEYSQVGKYLVVQSDVRSWCASCYNIGS
jgi:hypothetical protein